MQNFLQPALLPKVDSSSPCSDGYEPINLITNNIYKKGFLAYHTKPPVDVEFETICPISIRYIKIGAHVGHQTTTGIEILMKDETGNSVSISKSFFKEEGIIVCDSKYYSPTKLPCSADNYKVLYFKSYLHQVFLNTNKIIIRILQTLRSVPCLGSVEIWGFVSKSCSRITHNSINTLLNKSSNHNLKISKENSEEDDEINAQICDNCTFKIPEDFKDALTYELMALPLTLPSGNTIDQSTLDKCVANNASSGKRPSDPFTGVPFTATSKPTLNTPLKSRIDMFLVKNKNEAETHYLPRTSGRTHNFCATNVVYGVSAPKKFKHDSTPLTRNQERSLDEDIAEVFNRNDFIRFTSDEAVQVNKTECIHCKTNNNLYKLPCQHLCCRMCLHNFCIRLKCSCGNFFIRKDVIKHHTHVRL